MANNQPHSQPPSDDAAPPGGPPKRTRAPTITIDTSAVRKSGELHPQKSHEMSPLTDDGRASDAERSPKAPRLSTPASGERPSSDRDSRPTSPHNVSSPTHWNNPHGFLAVPPPSRSRGQSFDTQASGDTSSTSDFTFVNTHSPSEGGPQRLGSDDGKKFGAGEHPIVPDEEALKPDPGTEDDFSRENNPFAFAPGHMSKLLNPKSLGAFHAVGGLSGLEKGLRTNKNAGLSIDENFLDGTVSFEEATSSAAPDSGGSTAINSPEIAPEDQATGQGDFSDRRRVFGDNLLPEKKPKTIFQLMWLAYNDKVLWVLTVAAIIALALGLYQALGTAEGGVEWVEGVAIIVAIVVVVGVGAVNDWQKERQFAKLNKKKEARAVKVVRSGKTQEIDVHQLLVGDVLLVEAGDILPVDGVFVTGHGVKCDESSATGESDVLKKTASDEVLRAMDAGENVRKMDPFLISGAKVTEGYGRMLITATGVNSTYGKTMLSLQEDNEATPLQSKLNDLAEYIAKLGSAAALLLFVVLFIKFLAQLPNNHDEPAAKGREFINILIVAVTIIVVAVPEGLPLAVTLALAYATRRMLKDNNLVRVLRSCETMGNATTVCSDKTGTLTQNVMTVVAGAIGTSNRFTHRPSATPDGAEHTPAQSSGNQLDDVPLAEFVKALADPVKTLWKDSIAINSTAFEGEEEGRKVFIGSKTETALLDLASHHLAMDNTSVERGNAEIAQMIPFDSSRKCMGAVIKVDKNTYRLLVKGASEIMLSYSNNVLRDPTKSLETTAMTASDNQTFNKLIEAYASRSLRTIGFVYRDFTTESWPPKGTRRMEDDKTQAVFEDICKNMTFLGMVGIQDPLRPGVIEAVKDCLMAGVFPRMVTGDNITTAKAIATECGIYTRGGVALEGPKFRTMSTAEQRAIIPKLQVLARSSPDDKRVLVKRLKEMGETVAVTGDGTNDAPALKLSDVGFSMNIAGTEVAKEASDIILMDDNFTSIVNALMWGRAVNDAVRKFLQFQITVNITAVLLAFISAVSNDKEQSVLTAVQLLWVNLIMDTMAALALATDPPSRKILERKPDPKSAPLISVTMWKMVIGQAIYQLVVTLVLYFAGWHILNYDERPANITDKDWGDLISHRESLLNTLVFNTFVWMQIFNALNNRRLDNRFNVFEGIHRNLFFIGIFLIMVGGQVMIVFVGGAAFNTERQPAYLWGIALVLGAISLPIGAIIRLVPDELAVKIIPRSVRQWSARSKDNIVVTDEENVFQFNQALYDIRHELAWIKKYKGGRLNHLRFAVQHPREALLGHSRSSSRSRGNNDSLPRTPNNESVVDDASTHSPYPTTPDSRSRRSRSNSALTGAAMAGIIAGSIAGGWSPIEGGRRSGDNDNFWNTRERSNSALAREVRLEVHPETKSDSLAVPQDPVQEADGLPPSQSTKTTPQFGVGPFGGEPSSKKQDEKKDDTAP